LAGYVVGKDDLHHTFNIGQPDLIQRILTASPDRRVVMMQVDGDELAAVLWGLLNYGKAPRDNMIVDKPETPGVWAAFQPDWSNAQVFDEEIDCLRYAVENHCMVKFWEFGTDNPR